MMCFLKILTTRHFQDWTYEKMVRYTHSCVPPDTSQAKFYIHVHLGKIQTEDFNHLKFNISDAAAVHAKRP